MGEAVRRHEGGGGITVEHIENTGIDIFHFSPGERAMVKRGRFYQSYRTPQRTHGYECTVVRNNERSVSVRIAGYEEETHYIDVLDLVPIGYRMDTLG